MREWAKIKHIKSQRDFLPNEIDAFLSSPLALSPDLTHMNQPVAEPRDLSRYLVVHHTNPKLLYCHLTKRQVRNTYEDAHKHIDGAFFRHKSYEKIRSQLVRKVKVKLESKLRLAMKMIELKRMPKLRLSKKEDLLSEYNVFLKGFPRHHKLSRIIRFSRLIAMTCKS